MVPPSRLQQKRSTLLADLRIIFLPLLGYCLGWLSYMVFIEQQQNQSLQQQNLPLLSLHPGGIWDKENPDNTIHPSNQSVFVITATYRRSNQLAELIRIAQALYPSGNYINSWLIYEDNTDFQKLYSQWERQEFLTKHLQQFAKKINFKVHYTLTFRLENEPLMGRPKGVEAKRDGLAFVRRYKKAGVFYIADDDNTYDSDIFRQISSTKGVSVFPVGSVTQYGVGAPVVPKGQTEITEIFDGCKVDRRFPLDFAGFAVNIQLLHKNELATIPYIETYEETMFLSSLNISLKRFEALSPTEVLTWHTKTYKNNFDIKLLDWGQETPFRLISTNIEYLFKEYAFIREDPLNQPTDTEISPK